MGPAAVIIPGFARGPPSVAAFAKELSDCGIPARIGCLPGHGGVPLLEPLTMESLVAYFADRLARLGPTILIGESLGGLVALALASNPPTNLLSVFAVDPPLTMAKQAALHSQFERSAMTDLAGLWDAYAEAIFGLSRMEGRIVSIERDYRRFLAATPSVSAHIVVGGRERVWIPTVLDEDDRALIRASPGFILHSADRSAGHLVLSEAPVFVANLIASATFRTASPAK